MNEYEHSLADVIRILFRFNRKNDALLLDHSDETSDALAWIEDNSERVAEMVQQAMKPAPATSQPRKRERGAR